MILFHGTSASWLAQSGFARTNYAFGEAFPPHPFLHLSATRAGAVSAANNAYTSALKRIGSGTLKVGDFCFQNIIYPPFATVYAVDIPETVLLFDWSMDKPLGKADWKRIRCALWHVHCAHGLDGVIEFVGRLVKQCWNNTKWKEWIDFVVKTYMTGPDMDRRVKLFALAGYELIKGLESGQQYGAVYALVLPEIEPSLFKPYVV